MESGEITEDRIDASVRRILEQKAKRGVLGDPEICADVELLVAGLDAVELREFLEVRIHRRYRGSSVQVPAGVVVAAKVAAHAARSVAVAEAVEAREAGCRVARQHHLGPGHPVGLLGVDEVADDVEGAEGVGPLVRARPLVAKSLQQGTQRAWRALEHR